jgi:hypothetical protein
VNEEFFDKLDGVLPPAEPNNCFYVVLPRVATLTTSLPPRDAILRLVDFCTQNKPIPLEVEKVLSGELPIFVQPLKQPVIAYLWRDNKIITFETNLTQNIKNLIQSQLNSMRSLAMLMVIFPLMGLILSKILVQGFLQKTLKINQYHCLCTTF